MLSPSARHHIEILLMVSLLNVVAHSVNISMKLQLPLQVIISIIL
jgi:hypothetical protein